MSRDPNEMENIRGYLLVISSRALPSKQMSANLTVEQALPGLKALLLILISLYEVVLLLFSGLLAKFVSEH